jgi:uncharacterized low-complexity protein
MNKNVLTALALTSTVAFGALALADNPFSAKSLKSGYQVAQQAEPAKKTDGKCGEGKCGADKKAADAKKADGKCGEGKCGEGKCGADKKATDAKKADGKCGEGKCGADKKKEGSCGHVA